MELRHGGTGDFVVKVDGKVLWDKRRANNDEFPEDQQILGRIGAA